MYKLSRIIFCCSVALLITAATAENALAKDAKSSTPTEPVAISMEQNAIVPVNINLADAAALQKIKGFGKKKAQAIIEYRNKNGQFKLLEELLKVECRGINKKWLDKMSKFLTI
ncbi:MAG: hypothetical protein ACD_69C00314G0003 [uncultured bacterium]|nr:MAG: hypothetical protein ACD_69C00314G0003 [uncultured bacterium]OGT09538.1 MAG: hypothetical protein A2V89_02230 [Gammaproteobacteria bacterium RBG_16_37_9]HBC71484.1 transporter [Coxiellaceae bacterium]HBS51584.1 transporter [Coxiellaceae bacterium]HBY55758.1 transporter [Coxiellaceae bacterium]